MSSVESNSLRPMAEFNAEAVLIKLGILPEQKTRTAAIRLMYRLKTDEMYQPKQNRIEMARDIIEDHASHIQNRLELFDAYRDNFFTRKYSKKALTIAIICANLLNNARTLINANPSINLGIKNNLILEAHDIWQDASALFNHGYDADNGIDYDVEPAFLANIIGIVALRAMNNQFDEYTESELAGIQFESLEIARTYAATHYEIGQELIDAVDLMNERIEKAKLTFEKPDAVVLPFKPIAPPAP